MSKRRKTTKVSDEKIQEQQTVWRDFFSWLKAKEILDFQFVIGEFSSNSPGRSWITHGKTNRLDLSLNCQKTWVVFHNFPGVNLRFLQTIILLVLSTRTLYSFARGIALRWRQDPICCSSCAACRRRRSSSSSATTTTKSFASTTTSTLSLRVLCRQKTTRTSTTTRRNIRNPTRATSRCLPRECSAPVGKESVQSVGSPTTSIWFAGRRDTWTAFQSTTSSPRTSTAGEDFSASPRTATWSRRISKCASMTPRRGSASPTYPSTWSATARFPTSRLTPATT